MQRDMFVRLATMVIGQHGVANPAAVAEAIAAQMDVFNAIMGSAPAPAAAASTPAPAPRAAFPQANPEAVAPAPQVPVYEAVEQPPAPRPEPPPVHQPSLIVTDTRMPAPDERARSARPPAAEPLRQLKPQVRLKVEELNTMVQAHTPSRIFVDVPREDGAPFRVAFDRDVISMHNFDSVKVILCPPNALPSVREATQVQMTLHVDDAPFDFQAIMQSLAEQAIQSLRPREVVSVPPPNTSGPVQTTRSYDDGSSAAVQDAATMESTRAIFKSIG